jgi:hypothetical protein
MSPPLMTFEQNRCTLEWQAFCSDGVPLCWANALLDRKIEERSIVRKSMRMLSVVYEF